MLFVMSWQRLRIYRHRNDAQIALITFHIANIISNFRPSPTQSFFLTDFLIIYSYITLKFTIFRLSRIMRSCLMQSFAVYFVFS